MRKKVLICDDNLALLEMTKLTLASGYFKIECLSDMNDFFTFVDEFAPDIILLDIAMPHIDGVKATKILRNNPATAHIKIILFSANSKLPSIAAELGTDHISKPFNISELRSLIKSYALVPAT